jgi:hypothetical protein
MSQRIRRCSFCRIQGHNVSSCNDNRLIEFEQLCIARYANSESINYFESWLLDFYIGFPCLVKSYAVRYCGTTIRNYGMIHTAAISIRIQSLPIRRRPPPSISLTNELFQLYNNDFGEQHPLTYQEIVSHFLNLLETIQSTRRRERKFNIQTIITENTCCAETGTEAEVEEQCECSICYETLDKPTFIKLNCGHEFCKNCIKQLLQNEQRQIPCCAFCRTTICTFEMKSQEIRNEFNDLLM